MKTFKEFAFSRWKDYPLPMSGPLIVFTISFFTTNIGWKAIPLAVLISGAMLVIKTLMLYGDWRTIEKTIRAIEAAGAVTYISGDK